MATGAWCVRHIVRYGLRHVPSAVCRMVLSAVGGMVCGILWYHTHVPRYAASLFIALFVKTVRACCRRWDVAFPTDVALLEAPLMEEYGEGDTGARDTLGTGRERSMKGS